MSTAYGVLKVKSIEDTPNTRKIRGIASTITQDRDKDIIEADGAKFALPIPLLWQHNSNNPIGEVTSATVKDGVIEIEATIAVIDEDGPLKQRIDEAWQSIKSGLVKCLSVGFRVLEYNYLENSYGLHIKTWDWYELSVVTIPANPDATITSIKQIKKAFAEPHQNPTLQKQTDTEPQQVESEPETQQKSTHINLESPTTGAIPLQKGYTL